LIIEVVEIGEWEGDRPTMAKGEELPKTSPAEIEKLIEQIRASNMDAPVKEKLERLLRTVIALLDLLQRKNLSIKRLRNLLFGKRTEKLAEKSSSGEKENQEKKEPVKAEGEPTSGERNESESGKKKGHGRRAAKDYPGAKVVECRHAEMKAGEICPHPQCGGHLYHLNEPKMFMQFTGRPLISATNYEQEVLRCAKCQDRFVARLPEGISEERYDPTCDGTVALLKYDADLPCQLMIMLIMAVFLERPHEVFEDPIGHLSPLLSPQFVREAEIHALENTDVDHFLRGIRKAAISACVFNRRAQIGSRH
jgi:hypothetical protein